MTILGIPDFIFFAVLFEVAWGGFIVGVMPMRVRWAREQAAIAEEEGKPAPEIIPVPLWFRILEVSFAGFHIVALNLVMSDRPDLKAPFIPVLIVNGMLIALILYFLL